MHQIDKIKSQDIGKKLSERNRHRRLHRADEPILTERTYINRLPKFALHYRPTGCSDDDCGVIIVFGLIHEGKKKKKKKKKKKVPSSSLVRRRGGQRYKLHKVFVCTYRLLTPHNLILQML
jgi:hypothetical protein